MDKKLESFTWSNGVGTTDLGNYVRKEFDLSSSADISKESLCDSAPFNDNNSYGLDKLHYYISSASRLYLFLPDNTDGSYVANLCYTLATPITYQLTAPKVKTLLGLNNIWADTGNIKELVYRADLGKYLIGNLAANILNANSEERGKQT